MTDKDQRAPSASETIDQLKPEEGDVQRSGDFSRDPTFDPAELFEVIERSASIEHVLAAMREFERRGESQLFARGVALFARSARARGESVESVLGALEQIADELDKRAQPGFAQRETPLRNLVLRGVLLAFYGADAVRRGEDARDERVARRRIESGEIPNTVDETDPPPPGTR